MSIFPIAQSLAADLAGARVDPNEAQKALAYLRSRRSGKAFFSYLQAVVNNGQVVIRSRQTLDYYRALLQICERHLRPLQGDYKQMALALGWALRLLRYYRAVPEAVQEQVREHRSAPPPAQSSGARAPAGADDARPAPPGNPTAQSSGAVSTPQIPAVGEVFSGLVLERDDELVVIAVQGFSQDQAVAVLRVEPTTPKWAVGKDKARVEVVSQRKRGDLTILNVKRAASVKK